MPQRVTSHIGFEVNLTPKHIWKTYANTSKRGYVTFAVGLLRQPKALDKRRGADGRIVRRRSLLGDTLIHVILLYCAQLIETRMPNGAKNPLLGFIHFEKYLAQVYRWGDENYTCFSGQINREILDSYARWIADNCPHNDKYIGYVRDLYRFGLERRYPGFDEKTLRQLKMVKARTKFKGAVARLSDPRIGALNFEEERQVIVALETCQGRPEDRATMGLFHQTGMRGAAAIQLRLKHLKLTPAADRYSLSVPDSKQRSHTGATKVRYIEKWLGDLICTLIPEGATDDEAFLLHWLEAGPYGKDPTKAINALLMRFVQECNIVTLRLGEGASILPMTIYRLRRTMASNLAAQGASPWTIAEMLGDKTLAMALIYTNNSSTIVELLAETLDEHPAYYRILGLFLGKLENPDDNIHPIILGAVPYLVDFEKYAKQILEIGRCALGAECDLTPPLSCYRCGHFRALMELRAHERQLEQLKQQINQSVGIESDRVAAVLLDDIAAILSVIAAIAEAIGSASSRTDPRARVSKIIARSGANR